jgi:SAM-dependent methyltransferase
MRGVFAYSPAEVLDVYVGHPLSLASIRERLRRQGKDGKKEDDIAFDPETETTDQNHIGTVPFVLEMAAACSLAAADSVLDLGCGIGGPARLLAERFGCRVHGVDLSPGRIADAEELTRMTGLSSLVTYEWADFLSLPPIGKYTLVWGQNSWIHIHDREKLLALAREWLLPGGRVAFEDVCIARRLLDGDESEWFATISDAWRSSFCSVDDWAAAFRSAGLRVTLSCDRSEPYVEHYRKLVRLADAEPGRFPTHEVAGWRCAKWLGESGAFCFRRMVAVKE